MNYRLAISLVLCSLAFAALDANAEGLTMGLHVASIHAPQRGQNNANPGLYIRQDRWQAGMYRNSYSRNTFYAGYAQPIGPVELMLGIASGYDRRCRTTVTQIPAEVKRETFENGYTSTTKTPARAITYETCKGFSKHRLTPLVALSHAVPFTVLGAQPRIWFMPGFAKVASVAHISFEWSIK